MTDTETRYNTAKKERQIARAKVCEAFQAEFGAEMLGGGSSDFYRQATGKALDELEVAARAEGMWQERLRTELHPAGLRQEQTPTTGVNAFFGSIPDESDEGDEGR